MRSQALSRGFQFPEALFISLLFLIPIYQARNLQQQQHCSPSSCGDLKNISYPFSLAGDPVGCGHPRFQLSCESNKTVLNYRQGKYYVKGISYDERTIRLVDANLATGRCGLPYRSLSMDQAEDYNRFPSLIDYWQANFLNCSATVPDLAETLVPCLSGDGYRVYVNFSSNSYLFPYDIPKFCKVISRVPTSSKDGVNRPYETTLKLLASGFDLRWSVECSDCSEVGRSCVYKDNNDPRFFHCATDEYEYYETQLRIWIAFLVSQFVIDWAFVIRFIFLPLVVLAFLLHKWITRKKWLDAGNFQPQSESPKQVLIPKSMPRSA